MPTKSAVLMIRSIIVSRPSPRRSLSRSIRLAIRSGVSAAAMPPGSASVASWSARSGVRSATRCAAASRWRSRSRSYGGSAACRPSTEMTMDRR